MSTLFQTFAARRSASVPAGSRETPTVLSTTALRAAFRGTRLAIIVAVAAAVLVNVALAWQAGAAIEGLRVHEYELVRQARILELTTAEALSSGGDFLVVQEPRFVREFVEHRQEVRQAIGRLRELAGTPEGAALVERIDAQLRAALGGVERRIGLAQQGRLAQAKAEFVGAGVSARELSSLLDELVRHEEGRLRARFGQVHRERWGGLFLGAIMLVEAGLLALIVMNRRQRELQMAQGHADELAEARDRALAQAAGERARLFDLFMQAPAAIAITRGPEHVFELANDHCLDLAGPRELIGVAARDALPELIGRSFFDILDHVYDSGEPYVGTEVVLHVDRRGDGTLEEVCFDLICQPTRDAGGEIEGIFVHAVDVTEQWQLEREREALLASISHDLRNPLASIKGLAQVLGLRAGRIDHPDAERVAAGLATIDGTATKMADLIGELMDVLRAQSGRPLELDRRPTNLVRLARQAVIEQQQATERYQISFEADEASLIGSWDAERLERVIGNLLTNAVKYSPEGGEIRVHVGREGGETDAVAVLTVEDDGLGIPADDLPHVFERFHRARNVVGRIKGTGLGLAGARHIVQSHGGTITAESHEGVGSTFTVRLPLGE